MRDDNDYPVWDVYQLDSSWWYEYEYRSAPIVSGPYEIKALAQKACDAYIKQQLPRLQVDEWIKIYKKKARQYDY